MLLPWRALLVVPPGQDQGRTLHDQEWEQHQQGEDKEGLLPGAMAITSVIAIVMYTIAKTRIVETYQKQSTP